MLCSEGTPVLGYVSLTNGAPGPTNFTLFTVMGQAAYTLLVPVLGTFSAAGIPITPATPGDRVYITQLALSSSDTGQALVTVDTGGTTPTKIASQYMGGLVATTPSSANVVLSFWAGTVRGIFGVAPRAAATSVTATKTVECVLAGYISRT